MDIPFAVPFVHRVRFTDDLIGHQEQVLLRLLCDGAPGAAARVLCIVDAGVSAATGFGQRLAGMAGRHRDAIDLLEVLELQGGEPVKSDSRAIMVVLEAIERHHMDRRNYVLAVGGGAFLDAVGFAAALAHRGVRLIRLPTTTLSQGDSGVGVKNAVNFFQKKNWLGTFAVPWAVINDAALLQTLPDRDYRCGFAEAVKVSLLKDAAFFDRLCAEAPRIARREQDPSVRALRRSAELHLLHITCGNDPFEADEARPLDFGHWSAHRIEAMSSFTLRHGEAVATGLAIDCAYSALALGLPRDTSERVYRCLDDLQIPLARTYLNNVDALLAGLDEFRQHLGGRLTVTMLRGVGDPLDVHEIEPVAMREAIAMVARE